MLNSVFETEIKQYDFSKNGIIDIKKLQKGEDWPVVYILSNDREAYVGETLNAYNRMNQHLGNSQRQVLTKISLMLSDAFNKSAILDIENMLITHMHADGKFTLQNSNGGQSKLHNYYQRAAYQNCFEQIWEDLKKIDLVNHSLFEVQNSDIFKYSPFKMLTRDQYEIVEGLLNDYVKSLGRSERMDIVVQGGPGTGKSLIAIYFLNLLVGVIKNKIDFSDLEEDTEYFNKDLNLIEKIKENSDVRIGFVVSVPSFKATVKKICNSISLLKKIDIVSPSEATKKEYDVLIVDEAHRLKRRCKLTNYGAYDAANKRLNLDKEKTELDWLKHQAKKMLILFYDNNQKVKESDVLKEDFDALLDATGTKKYWLNSQLRVKGGNEYMEFVSRLFTSSPINYNKVGEYDVKVYDDCHQMFEEIKKKNKKYSGLCRVLAGLSFDWRKKVRDKSSEVYSRDYDFVIDGYKYCWNQDFNDSNFIINDKYLDSVGCIYTSQGHDLNFAGIILGNDIKYNIKTNRIEFNTKKFIDTNSKSRDDNVTIENIINAYKVLLTRGIYGTYIYACDKNLREYIKQLIIK